MQEHSQIKYKEVKAEIYNFRAWFYTQDLVLLKKQLDEALSFSGYTVLKFIDYKFPVKGYTSVWLLAESHLALHFFEEEQKSYVELSGCNKEMNLLFQEYFKSRKITFEEIN